MTKSAAPGTENILQTCKYDASTKEYTCTLTRMQPSPFTVTNTYNYDSVSDFVDEVKVIPPIARYTTGSIKHTYSGPGTRTGKLTVSYDVQRRMTRLAQVFDDGTSLTLTYTAWDAAGRRPLAKPPAAKHLRSRIHTTTANAP